MLMNFLMVINYLPGATGNLKNVFFEIWVQLYCLKTANSLSKTG